MSPPVRTPEEGCVVGVGEPSPEPGPPPAGFTAWPVVVGLCSLGIALSYADRSNISVSAISMAAEFGWTKVFEGTVLSAFFLGYSATQLLGGQLADALGGKRVLAAGLGIWSAATFITPAAAHAGPAALLAARVALGLGEGVAFPAVHSIIAACVPAGRQSTAVALVTGASYGGAALAFLAVPPVIATWGWPASFQLFGAAALLWLPLWLPVQIAQGARSATAPQGGLRARAAAAWSQLLPVLRRREVLAICAAQYCGSYGLYGLLSWLPTFFTEQYGVPLADLPSVTFVPYILQAGVGVLTGAAADRLLAQGVPRRDVRVRLQAAGMLIPAACLLLAVSPVAAGSASLGALCIDCGLAASALTLGGVSANHLDVAPRHAGAVFGAGNTAATLAGLVSVPLTGALLDTTGSWALVWGVTAAHYVLGAALFALWAGAEPVPESAALQ
jgi:ACS family sodium-dependent inorganic phosphate cotransporter